MDTDMVLTIGIVIFALTVPSLLSAWVEGRLPVVAGVMLLASIGMVAGAIITRPGGYSFEEIPGIMIAVVASAVN